MPIRQIAASSFRGIPTHLAIDFSDNRDHKARSIILFGDNGSGKSSIVDALEFGVRGRLSRRGFRGQKQKREVRNVLTNRAPGVALVLSDGTTVRRGGGVKDSDEPDWKTRVVPGFEYSPIVIRRHDVESFWTIPSDMRQDFFFDYLSNLEDPSGELARQAEQRHARVEEALRRSRLRMRRAFGPDLVLPKKHAETKTLLRRLLREQGIPATGNHRRLPKGKYESFAAYQDALRMAEELDRVEAEQVTGPSDNQLREVLGKIGQRVGEDFEAVTGKDWISAVSMEIDNSKGLDITLTLTNGRMADPTQVLNEASLDLLALLILLEVHIQCATLGQHKVIVLDDVFQSVDAVHRIRSLEHVLGRLRKWQVFLTLHDRLWLELAAASMHRNGHGDVQVIEVRSTSSDEAPEIRLAGFSPLQELERIERADFGPAILAGTAGRLLEQLCDRLSVSLAISVTRRRGDKYTLGDLWPGVSAALKKVDGEATNLAQQIDMLWTLRNMAGAHYNEWASSLSRQEASDFSAAVRGLWNATTCATCNALLTTFRGQQGSKSFVELACKCIPATTIDEVDADSPGASNSE